MVDRICAIFNINDQSRVKIVGVYNGSTSVELSINPNNNGTTAGNVSDHNVNVAFNNQVQKCIASGVFTKETAAIGLPLLSASSTLIPIRPITEDTQENSDDTERKIIIGVSVSIAAVVLIVTAIIIYIKKTSNNKVSE